MSNLSCTLFVMSGFDWPLLTSGGLLPFAKCLKEPLVNTLSEKCVDLWYELNLDLELIVRGTGNSAQFKEAIRIAEINR